MNKRKKTAILVIILLLINVMFFTSYLLFGKGEDLFSFDPFNISSEKENSIEITKLQLSDPNKNYKIGESIEITFQLNNMDVTPVQVTINNKTYPVSKKEKITLF